MGLWKRSCSQALLDELRLQADPSLRIFQHWWGLTEQLHEGDLKSLEFWWKLDVLG